MERRDGVLCSALGLVEASRSAHGPRGYVAVQWAAALPVADDELVAASGDQELLTARRDDGPAVVDTNTWSLRARPDTTDARAARPPLG